MEGMEEKLGSILGNPAMMQQIMAMAQSLGQTAPEPQRSAPADQAPGIDPAMLTKVMSLAGQTNIDPNQRTLLHALEPYLTRQRIDKLEKAMRAARLATLASSFLGTNLSTGR